MVGIHVVVPVLALAVTAATLTVSGIGIARAWRRKWRASVVFGGLGIVGGVTNLVGLPALVAIALASWWQATDADPGDRARELGETIADAMNWGAVGLLGFPVGIVLVVVGAAGSYRTRRRPFDAVG